MGFLTRSYWEMTGIHRTFLENEERIYPFIETQFFNNFYMIDFHEPLPIHEQSDDLKALSKRLLVSNWELLFDVLLNLEKDDNTIDSVTLVRGNNDPRGAMASLITETYYCHDKANQMALFFKLKNGCEEIESLLAEKPKDLVIKDCLIKDQKLTESARAHFMQSELG